MDLQSVFTSSFGVELRLILGPATNWLGDLQWLVSLSLSLPICRLGSGCTFAGLL